MHGLCSDLNVERDVMRTFLCGRARVRMHAYGMLRHAVKACTA